MKFLALTSYLLARITLTLMSSFAIPVVFTKSIFRNLTYVLISALSCHLHSRMCYVSYLKNRLFYVEITKAVVRMCSVKTVFLEISQNSQENTCARDSFLIKLQTRPPLVQVFSYEFCEISKNTFLTEHLRATASVFPHKTAYSFHNSDKACKNADGNSKFI